MAKRKNLKHYLLYGLLTGLFLGGMQWLTLNVTKLPIKTENFFSETDKIKEGLNLLTTVYCQKVSDWYCGKNSFEVLAIEATRDNSFSTGTDKAENGNEFWWVAVKNESWWNGMILLKNEEKIKCNEIPDKLGPEMFGEKLRFCEDENGKTIDRKISN
jgi:hypothetical protein